MHTIESTLTGSQVATAPTAYAAKLDAPFAVLGIRTAGGALTGITYLPPGTHAQAPADATAERVCRQLQHYLADAQFRFTVPLAPSGTPFRRRVWDALASIPVGESRTYGEMARKLATAARAVGGACGANPIALVIPCHRVVGSQGSLGGFMGVTAGDPIAIKRWLLAHEGYRFGR
ncbi:MAG: methylated-DNA--[protein]-cysteine S-methyltransferase [Casimicrobiaceae bacterium]